MAYKISAFVAKSVNLFTIQSIARQKLFPLLAKTNNNTILTTIYPTSLSRYGSQLKNISKNPYIRIIPNYYPLIYQHNELSSITMQSPENPRKISLLIGDHNESLTKQFNPNRIVTLEQVCRAFPQKVPLSLRNKPAADQNRAIIQKRIGTKIQKDKVIQFEHIFITNSVIKMWDQALQVILDCQPTPIYVPYFQEELSEDGLYRLRISDFVRALKKVHETVSKAVKTHPPLNLIEFNQQRQLNWLITHVAPQAQKMTIDNQFFSEKPKISECEDKSGVSLVDDLKSSL